MLGIHVSPLVAYVLQQIKFFPAFIYDYGAVFAAGLAFTQMVQAEIGNDSVDPGIERTFKAKTPQVSISLQKGFLVDVLGILFRTCEVQSQPENRLIVLAHQLLKRRARAALRLANQLAVVHAAQGVACHVSPAGMLGTTGTTCTNR